MDGALIGDETGIRERWMEHFKHILNEDDDNLEEGDQEDSENQIEGCTEPTENEVNNNLNKLKNNKSQGGNGVAAENICGPHREPPSSKDSVEYTCNGCGRVFDSMQGLRQHEKRAHPFAYYAAIEGSERSATQDFPEVPETPTEPSVVPEA